jgi:hypothetical protein
VVVHYWQTQGREEWKSFVELAMCLVKMATFNHPGDPGAAFLRFVVQRVRSNIWAGVVFSFVERTRMSPEVRRIVCESFMGLATHALAGNDRELMVSYASAGVAICPEAALPIASGLRVLAGLMEFKDACFVLTRDVLLRGCLKVGRCVAHTHTAEHCYGMIHLLLY